MCIHTPPTHTHTQPTAQMLGPWEPGGNRARLAAVTLLPGGTSCVPNEVHPSSLSKLVVVEVGGCDSLPWPGASPPCGPRSCRHLCTRRQWLSELCVPRGERTAEGPRSGTAGLHKPPLSCLLLNASFRSLTGTSGKIPRALGGTRSRQCPPERDAGAWPPGGLRGACFLESRGPRCFCRAGQGRRGGRGASACWPVGTPLLWSGGWGGSPGRGARRPAAFGREPGAPPR